MRGIFACVSAALAAFGMCSGSEIWVGSYFENKVTRFDAASGAKIGELAGPVNGPLGMTLHDGVVYITAEIDNKIRKYDAKTAAYLGDFVTANVNHPTAVAVGMGGDFFVANFNDNSVSRFSNTGTYKGRFVTAGSGGLNGPDLGMAFGPDGDLYVPSYYGNSIMRYDGTTGASKGAFITAGSGGLSQPRQLVWRSGELFVSSDNGNKVLRYNAANGSFLGTFVSPGSGTLSGAVGMMFSQDAVYVASSRNGKILRYDNTTGAYKDVFASGLGSPVSILAVPEPGSMVLVTAGAAVASAWKKKRQTSRQ